MKSIDHHSKPDRDPPTTWSHKANGNLCTYLTMVMQKIKILTLNSGKSKSQLSCRLSLAYTTFLKCIINSNTLIFSAG